jgi:hypothetical protein
MRLTREQWHAEGRRLSQSASDQSWEIGRWLCRGEELFLGEPSQTNKKERKLWWARYREMLKAFIAEAAEVTSLSESALRQCRRVVQHGVRVEGLKFSHHIEVQRAHFYDEKGKRRFDSNAAQEILNVAKENNWTVAQTRNEVQRRYPTSAVVESVVGKAERLLMEILSSTSEQDYVAVVDALFTALQQVKESPKYQRGEVVLTWEEERAKSLGIDFYY